MDSKSDAELVGLARTGNRDACSELIRRDQHQLCGLACILVDDRFEAEDLTQEAFLRAWLKVDWLRAFRPDLYRLSDVKIESQPQQGRRSPRRPGKHGPFSGDAGATEDAADAGFRCGRVPPGLEDVFKEQTMRKPVMLHITDGESVAGTLREAGIPGEVSIYGDLMYEGPTPAGLTADAWRHARAGFMAEAGYATVDEAQEYLKACDDALAAFPRHGEIVIWLDHRLSDQLILIRVLDWFSRQNLGGVKLSLICVARFPGMDHFVGLGQLTAGQLASLADTRLQVTDAQFRLAQAAWRAFTSPDPTAIERFLEMDTSALPFIVAAFRRHLEQFPSVDGGLSRTERQALSILREQGSVPGGRLFTAVQRLEEQIFMGDRSFYRIIANLSVGRNPLLQASGTPRAGLGAVTITEAGRNVIEGRADHIDLNGIDRWLGGVHLNGLKSAWRWHRASAQLVMG